MKHRSSCRRPAPVVLSRRSSGPTGFQEAPVVWGRRSAARSSFSLAALATVPREGPRTRATSTTRHLHRCRFPAPVARSRRFTHRLAASPSRSPIRRQRRRPPFHTAPDPAASPFEAGGAAPPQPPEHLNPFRRALLAGRGNDGEALPVNDARQSGAGGFSRLLRRSLRLSPPSIAQQQHPHRVRSQPQPHTSDTPSSHAMRPPPALHCSFHMSSRYAQTLAPVPPQPPFHAVQALTLSSQLAWLRESTLSWRPTRSQRRHVISLEISKRIPPTGPPEPDSGQLQRHCDIMDARGPV